MAASTTRNLYLQISANADDLTRVAKAAQVTIAGLGAASGDLQKTMAENFRQIGGGDVQQSARQIETAYRRAFSNIRAAAEETLSKPITAAGIVGGNIAGAEAQLAKARATASAYQELADAQTRIAQSSGSANAGEQQMAVLLTGQALAAKESVAGLEQQLATLRSLRTQLGITTDAEEEASASHNRMGASGMIAEHVVRSFSDSIAAGQSPVRALTMEMGRITEAMTLYAAQTNTTEGAMGKFAAFMGSGWGIAISVGVAALTPLISKLFENADASDDAKKASDEYAKAQDNFANAIDKANGKLVERNRLLTTIALQEKAPEIEKQEAASRDFSKQAFAAADTGAAGGAAAQQAGLLTEAGGVGPVERNAAIDKAIANSNGNVIKLRNNLNALAKQASGDDKASLRALADEVNHLAGRSIDAAKQADALRGKASEVAIALRGGTVLTTDAARRQIEEKNASTPLEKAQIKLRELDDQKADIDAMPYGPAQQAAVKKWSAELDAATAAVKRLQAAQKDDREGRQVGRQINLSQAEDIVHGIGGRVTSAQRSTAEQQLLYDRYKAGAGSLAAKPGTSGHERGQALDVAKAAGVTLAALKKAFADQGVHLTEALDEGNHYHVAWGPKGPSADTLARRQQSARRKAANDDRAYQGQLRQAQDAYAQAQLGLTDTAQERYQVSVALLRSDLDTRDRALDDQVTAGSLSAAEALQLKVIYGMTEQLEEQRARREEMTSLLDQQLSAARSQLQSDLTLLQLRQQGAVGRAAQYDFARQTLAKQQEEDRDAIAQRINNAGRNPEDAARAVQEAQSLPAIQEQQRKNLAKQYQSPLASYKDQLQQNVGNMNDALQGVAVNGLKGIEDGLTGILSGTESVKRAFKSMATSIISDLIRIGIEKAVLGALGGSGGIFGKLFGGGSHADGGLITAGTGPRSDDVLARVSRGEFIVNAASASKNMHLLHAINDNRTSRFADGGLVGGAIPQMASLSSADVRSLSRPQQPILISVRRGEMFEPYVHGAAAQHAQVAYSNATEDGANLAASRSAWSQGRALGGSH